MSNNSHKSLQTHVQFGIQNLPDAPYQHSGMRTRKIKVTDSQKKSQQKLPKAFARLGLIAGSQ